MKTVVKILAALAAVAGVVFVIAAYGDKIVAWAKKLAGSCPLCHCHKDVVDAEEAPAEEAAAEEAPAEEAEEAPAAEAEEAAPVAEEADFEG